MQVNQQNVQQLDPTLPRLEEMVTKFLPDDKKFLRVTNATREIVRGVRFTIHFVMRESIAIDYESEIFCEIIVLEKPWLIRNNRKFSEMTSNNCSLPVTNDRFHYVVNQAFVNSQSEPTNVDDQIITTEKSTTTTASTTIIASDDVDEATTESFASPVLSGNSMSFLDSFFNVNNFLPSSSSSPSQPTESSTTAPEGASETQQEGAVKLATVDNSENSPLNSESFNDTINNNGSSETGSEKQREIDTKSLEIEIRKAFSELFQNNPEFQARFISLIHRTDNSKVEENSKFIVNILTHHIKDKFETLLNQNNSILRARRASASNIKELSEEALDTLDRADDDDNKRMLLKIIKVTDAFGHEKNSLQIEVEIANSECQENSQEIDECVEKIDEQTKKICLLEVTKLRLFSIKIAEINLISNFLCFLIHCLCL